MPPQIATVLFAIGIAGLFWLDRDRTARPSKALWLPIIWLSEAGLRSLAAWLDMGAPKEIPGQIPASSPLDQLFASALMLLGAIVLTRRGRIVKDLLKASWPIVLYFSFCLISLVWSDFPAWSFKRWVGSGRFDHGPDCCYRRAADCGLEASVFASRVCPAACFRPSDQVLPGTGPGL